MIDCSFCQCDRATHFNVPTNYGLRDLCEPCAKIHFWRRAREKPDPNQVQRPAVAWRAVASCSSTHTL